MPRSQQEPMPCRQCSSEQRHGQNLTLRTCKGPMTGARYGLYVALCDLMPNRVCASTWGTTLWLHRHSADHTCYAISMCLQGALCAHRAVQPVCNGCAVVALLRLPGGAPALPGQRWVNPLSPYQSFCFRVNLLQLGVGRRCQATGPVDAGTWAPHVIADPAGLARRPYEAGPM